MAISVTESILSAVRVVLYEPQDPVNIAATIRAMKNMGCSDLYLVRSVGDVLDVGGGDGALAQLIAPRARTVACLDRSERMIAAARDRLAVRPNARACVGDMHALPLLEFARNGPVAVLFGREDKGLPNEILDRAHMLVTIPTTGHASLNLAQAVLIALYELHLTAADATRTLAPPRKDAPPATAEEYEQLFSDTERALYQIDFFKTRFHEHIMRTVRTLFYRAAPDSRELALLRAIFIEVVRTIERITRGKAGGLQQ